MKDLPMKIISIFLLILGTSGIVLVSASLSGKILAQTPSPEVPTPQQGGRAPSLPPPSSTPANPGAPAVITGDEKSNVLKAPPVPGFVPVEGYTYDPTGLRDPFKPWAEVMPKPAQAGSNQGPGAEIVSSDPLQNFELAQLKVVGIIWGTKSARAMVRDPVGKLHVVRKNTKIGRKNGFVAAIREGEVVVIEPIREGNSVTPTPRIMVISKE